MFLPLAATTLTLSAAFAVIVIDRFTARASVFAQRGAQDEARVAQVVNCPRGEDGSSMLRHSSRPLGVLEILYTPVAMVVAQAVIASPIVTGITLAAVQNVPEAFRLQLVALGASRAQMVWVVLREARLPMLAAVMAGFGAVISEIGASLMVGGNIKGHTRTLTTAMVLETSKGNFDAAIALAVLLLVLIFLVNWGFTVVQQRRAP